MPEIMTQEKPNQIKNQIKNNPDIQWINPEESLPKTGQEIVDKGLLGKVVADRENAKKELEGLRAGKQVGEKISISAANREILSRFLEKRIKKIDAQIEAVKTVKDIGFAEFDLENAQKLKQFIGDRKPVVVKDTKGEYHLVAHGNIDPNTGRHTLESKEAGKTVDTEKYIRQIIESGEVPAGAKLHVRSCKLGEYQKTKDTNGNETSFEKTKWPLDVQVSRTTEEPGNLQMGIKSIRNYRGGESNIVSFQRERK